MLIVTIKGQKINCGQYVLARCVTPFPCGASSSLDPFALCSVPNDRTAKIHFFFIHTVQVNNSELINHSFAYVCWPMHHPLHSSIGKPYEVWCSSLFEISNVNCIIPTDNIVSR